jgi:hypothetical protein
VKVPRLEPIAPGVWLLRGGLTRTVADLEAATR